MEYKVSLFHPYVPETAIQAVSDTLRTKWIGQGGRVDEFEKEIGNRFSLPYPLMTNSGTSALELAYDMAGIQPGDEVVSSVLTCTATNIPLLRRGANIVFADIDPDSMVMTNETLAKAITNKTKLVVGVSLGGVKCEIADSWNTPTVIDAAQALGHNNGDYTVYSFQAIKHITTGDGGLLNLPDEEQYQKAKKLRWFGIDREQKKRNDWQSYKEREMVFDIEYPGYKYQPTDIAASMGLAGLAEYDELIRQRAEIFKFYKSELDGYEGIKMVDGKDNVYWLATLLVPDRDAFAKRLAEKGVETNMVQLRNDIFKIFGGKRRDLPNMNRIEEHYISIPLHNRMSMGDAEYVVDCIKK